MELVAEPSNNEEARLDLVFVHGTTDSWRQTWKRDDNSSWIEDFLPVDIPQVRIQAWGLNVLNSPQKYPPFPTDGLKDYERERDPKCPVLFFAHSFGGLILQEFFQHCSEPLRIATKGFMFFGTPNLSQPDHQRFRYAIEMANIGRSMTLDYLELSSICNWFANWLDDQRFAGGMVCFYERLPVTNSVIIVDEESAMFPHCDRRGLDANHMTMTTFTSAPSTNYQIVLQCMRTMYCLADVNISVLFRHSLKENSHGNLSSLPAAPDGCEEVMMSIMGNPAIRDDGILALVAEDQGQYEKAEKSFRAVVEKLGSQGRCSPGIRQLGRQAVAFADRGLDNEMEANLKRAAGHLQGLDSSGRDDAAFLFFLNKWAWLLCNRGRYKHAELYCRCCLAARVQVSGKGSAPTLLTATNLFVALTRQEQYKEARGILQDALENQDPTTQSPTAKAAVLVAFTTYALECGSYELAETLSSEVLRESIKLHGLGHPFTLKSMANLAAVLATKEEHLPRAEALSRRALDGLEQALGSGHPDCLRTACDLANYICVQYRHDDAARRHKQILDEQRMRTGVEHPDTLLTMRSLGIGFALQGHWKDSESLLDQALHGLTICVGSEDRQRRRTAEALEIVRALQEEHPQEHNMQGRLLECLLSTSAPPGIFRRNDFTRSYFHTVDEGVLLQAAVSNDWKAFGDELIAQNVTPHILGRALREAAACSNEPVVTHLLEAGAPVGEHGGFLGNALQAAADAGSEAIIKLLLEQKADVNYEGGILGNALRAAVFRDHGAVIDSLLTSISPQNFSNNILNSSLRLAMRTGNVAIIESLLKAGADLNAHDELFGSPVQQASFYGQRVVMVFLYQRGANINSKGGIFANPLQAAIETQNEAVVTYLLENGATVRSGSEDRLPNEGMSPSKREELAKILLKPVADTLPQRSLSVRYRSWEPIRISERQGTGVSDTTDTMRSRFSKGGRLTTQSLPIERRSSPNSFFVAHQDSLEQDSKSSIESLVKKRPNGSLTIRTKQTFRSLGKKLAGRTR